MRNHAHIFTYTLLIGLLLHGGPLMAQPVFRVAYPSIENSPRAIGSGVEVPTEHPGITVELLQMVGETLGLELEFVRAPWNRCLYLVERGTVDAAFHASYKPERAEYGVYPSRNGRLDPERAIYIGRYVVYVRDGSGVDWDGKRFIGLTHPVGAMQGAAGASDLRKMSHSVEEERNVQVNFDKLQAGRISAYVEIETIGDNYLEEHPLPPTIQKLSITFTEKVYYLMISKQFYQKHRQLAEAIFNAVRDLKQQDAYQTMVKKYQ